jgi:hypothetical protein
MALLDVLVDVEQYRALIRSAPKRRLAKAVPLPSII